MNLLNHSSAWTHRVNTDENCPRRRSLVRANSAECHHHHHHRHPYCLVLHLMIDVCVRCWCKKQLTSIISQNAIANSEITFVKDFDLMLFLDAAKTNHLSQLIVLDEERNIWTTDASPSFSMSLCLFLCLSFYLHQYEMVILDRRASELYTIFVCLFSLWSLLKSLIVIEVDQNEEQGDDGDGIEI